MTVVYVYAEYLKECRSVSYFQTKFSYMEWLFNDIWLFFEPIQFFAPLFS